MFFFGKKEMNTDAANRFWQWFVDNESWIIENINTTAMEVVFEIDAQIKPVFPYFKKELEFQLGYNDGVGEFFFFHFGNKNLIEDAKRLADMMPDVLQENWKFISEK